MEFLNPDKILDELILQTDMVVADFGCGSGGFTIPLAKKIKDGMVYALDIQKAPLSSLKSYYLKRGIGNIKVEQCDLEKFKGSNLKDSSVNLVSIVNTLFQTEDKTAIISEAKRILKKSGNLLIVDWNVKTPRSFIQEKILSEEVEKIAQNLNLKQIKKLEAGKYHYGLLFKK